MYIMKTALITVKTKPEIKKEAQEIAANLGFSLSGVVNAYLHQFVKNRTVYFTDIQEEPSDSLIKILKESEKERQNGDYDSFDNVDEAVNFLDNIIDNSKNEN